MSLLTACAANQEYKKPTSSYKNKSHYRHEQLDSPAAKQVTGAALSGVIGGLLGPLGILVTAIGSNVSQKQGIVSYLKQMDNTEMVGIVLEDVTDKRNKQFLSNPRWFKNLPSKDQLPKQLNVDLGSGNSFIFPLMPGLEVGEGDIVTILASNTTHNLASINADFYKDLPLIISLRCKNTDIQCITLPENEQGIVKRISN